MKLTCLFFFFVFTQSTLARHCGIGTEFKKNHTYSALSKCGNGNGSIRLTATIIPSPINRNAQNNDDAVATTDISLRRQQLQQQRHEENVKNCLKNNCPNEHHKYRHRCVSVSSQGTLLTTVSRNDTMITINNGQSESTLDGNGGGGVVVTTSIGKRPHQSTLGTIAEKLRRGTIMLFSSSPSSPDGTTVGSTTADATNKLQKDSSVDSAHTNTISNSSLQEVDAEEFDSAELAKYMGEVNNEIR